MVKILVLLIQNTYDTIFFKRCATFTIFSQQIRGG